jgi:hypothetical protein
MLVGKLEATEREGSKHTNFEILDGEVLVARTVLSRSYGEVDDSLLSQIARQLHVKRDQLNKLIECTWSRRDYLDYVLE